MTVSIDSFVDVHRGSVSRRIFVDQELYKAEQEKIFGRCWLFLAHESQVPNPGDFVTTYMGETPVIVMRSKAGRIGAFFNSCRHRGMRLCRADAGNAHAFTCSYHGWVYGNDGALTGVPRQLDAYPPADSAGKGGFDAADWALVPVAQLDSYKGLLFATWDRSSPPLISYLGDMAGYLDILIDRRDGGTEFLGGTQKWTIPCNWKFVTDNHVGDSYHTPTTHNSNMMVGIYSKPSERLKLPGKTLYAGNGHGFCYFNTSLRTDLAPLKDYVEATQPEAVSRLGQARANIWPLNGAIFPNFGFVYAGAFRTFRVWHPRGPDKIEIWSWCVVDRNASPEFKDFIRLETLRGQSGPASTFEQDDGENFKECHACSKGPIAELFPFNHMLRLGTETHHPELAGVINEMPSETNQLGFYSRWADYMRAPGSLSGTAA
jgi:nitrite reductase/ring-hydroxylating ferredoxin subunit